MATTTDADDFPALKAEMRLMMLQGFKLAISYAELAAKYEREPIGYLQEILSRLEAGATDEPV